MKLVFLDGQRMREGDDDDFVWREDGSIHFNFDVEKRQRISVVDTERGGDVDYEPVVLWVRSKFEWKAG